MGAVSSLNSLLRTRIERSNAWHWHSPLQLGITPSPQTDGYAHIPYHYTISISC